MLKMISLKNILLPIVEKIELFRRRFVDPEKYVRKIFLKRVGYPLNLEAPRTYNEKLQWLKLYWHHPILTKLVDKNLVKEYVADKIGIEYIIPTLGVWDKVSDIDWGLLPEQFVFKCTHDSGGLVICSDKSKLNKKATIEKLSKSLSQNYYYYGFEWPYKNVKPRIIAEAYISDSRYTSLLDYKFYCFDGEVKAMLVATDRNVKDTEVKFDYFDSEFNHLDITWGGLNTSKEISKPECFDEMKMLASKLSEGFPHVRVDFYEVNGKVYFGELTFFSDAGFVKVEPPKWDFIFGEWINLPKSKIL